MNFLQENNTIQGANMSIAKNYKKFQIYIENITSIKYLLRQINENLNQ